MTAVKILILSDSHGRVSNLLDAVDREKPDRVFHLGDLIRDTEDLMALYPEIPIHRVVGNCDGWSAGAEELEVTLEGVRFLLVHGHDQRAKSGIAGLLQAGWARKADVVCFGHTHQPYLELQRDGMWLVNPGTAGGVYRGATYVVADARDGKVSFVLKEL